MFLINLAVHNVRGIFLASLLPFIREGRHTSRTTHSAPGYQGLTKLHMDPKRQILMALWNSGQLQSVALLMIFWNQVWNPLSLLIPSHTTTKGFLFVCLFRFLPLYAAKPIKDASHIENNNIPLAVGVPISSVICW